MKKRILLQINRLKMVLLFGMIPLYAGCGTSSYSVSNNESIEKSIVEELHGYLEPLVLALATLGVAYNGILIIFDPAGNTAADEALYIAKKRIIIILSAVAAFYVIKSIFSTDFAGIWS